MASNGKQDGGLGSFLCPRTLGFTLRSAIETDLRAREGVKELLGQSLSPANQIAEPTPTADSHRWIRCLDVLVEDFLSRKHEISRLNSARRKQIEEFLRAGSATKASLEEMLAGRVGSVEQEALLEFAYQVSVFHLMQILLVKRWRDSGLIEKNQPARPQQTLNWQITGFLKKNSPKGVMKRHEWSFLKQNIFSWFTPSKEADERIQLLTANIDLSRQTPDFPPKFLATLVEGTRMRLGGFRRTLFDSASLWRLLLERKAADLRCESVGELGLGTEAGGPILVSGLRYGESLISLQSLVKRELHGLWAFTNSDLERFLAELSLLWTPASEIPQINIHSRTALSDSKISSKDPSLFGEGLRLPYQAQLAACFPGEESGELRDTAVFLEHLREHGLLLLASDQFWPTEGGAVAQAARETALRLSSIRLIVDLRQLSGTEGEHVPKGLFVPEKCSSKELRDSNRPQIIRVRGHLQAEQVPALWALLIALARQETAPGEVSVRALQALGDGVRLETMAAAACQQQLRGTPWITLSDPMFYEINNKLQRHLSKAHVHGTVLKWKAGLSCPSPRGVLFQDHGKALIAVRAGEESQLSEDLPRYFFHPESSVSESPVFFTAQADSSPAQFWHRLETEQRNGSRLKQAERQWEQRLKLMPVVRLFDPGALIPVGDRPLNIGSLDELKNELSRIFRCFGMAERARLHQIVLGLDNSIRQNISACSELSKHIFPDLEIQRWSVPNAPKEVAPEIVFEIFRHLDKSPLLHHPMVQITKLRPVNDFKVASTSLTEMPLGAAAELQVFHGSDAVIRLHGPSLILRAASAELDRRSGRPWLETADRMQFPTDIRLVQTQLKEIQNSIQQQLHATRECVAVMDQIFCCLFGLATRFDDDGPRLAIQHHLHPEEPKFMQPVQRPAATSSFRQEDSQCPTSFLQ